jgi:hypothetical protein
MCTSGIAVFHQANSYEAPIPGRICSCSACSYLHFVAAVSCIGIVAADYPRARLPRLPTRFAPSSFGSVLGHLQFFGGRLKLTCDDEMDAAGSACFFNCSNLIYCLVLSASAAIILAEWII